MTRVPFVLLYSVLGAGVVDSVVHDGSGSLEKLGFAGFAGMLLWMFWKKSQKQDQQQGELIAGMLNELGHTNTAVRALSQDLKTLTDELKGRPCVMERENK